MWDADGKTAMRGQSKIGGEALNRSSVFAPGFGLGNIVTIEVECQHVTEVFTGFGEVGRPAEAVAMHAVQQCQRYLKASAPAGEYLTDQLMLPMGVSRGGRFVATGLSRHSQTHLQLIRDFLSVPIETEKQSDGSTLLRFGDAESK